MAEVASLIRSERETPWFLIFLGGGDDESEIRFLPGCRRFLIALADALRELHFLLACDEGKDADVPRY